MTKAELLEKANSLPLAPGVYLMRDAEGTVIYVGKAKKLKNRVSQYFQSGRGHNLKTHIMVENVDSFDTIIVGSEFEALVLENALIKQHMPHYNILLKDDKGYPFVRLSREDYPRFSIVSRVQSDGARYFGPFGGRAETRSALDAIAGALHLPTCSRRFPPGYRGRAPLSQPPHGPVRRLLPAGDVGGGVQPPDGYGGADPGGPDPAGDGGDGAGDAGGGGGAAL